MSRISAPYATVLRACSKWNLLSGLKKVLSEIAKAFELPKKSCCTHKCRVGLAFGANRVHVAASGYSVAIETHARAGLGSADANDRTTLPSGLDFVWRDTWIARNDHKAKEPGFRTVSLQQNRIVLTCLHPVMFVRNATYIAQQDQDEHLKMSICSEAACAMVREHSMSRVGDIGEAVAAGVDRGDTRREIARCVDQKLETLHPPCCCRGPGAVCEFLPYARSIGKALRRVRFMRIHCEEHGFRPESRLRTALAVDAKLQTTGGGYLLRG